MTTKGGFRRGLVRPLAVIITAILVFVGTLGVATAIPTAPGGLSLSVDNTTIRATWTAVTGATGYEVQFSKDKKFNSGVTSVKSTGTTAYANKLSENATYYVKVRSTDATGPSSWSSTKDAKTKVTMSAPSGLKADNIGGTAVELSWTGVAEASAYVVKATASGKSAVWASGSGTYTTVTGLSKATKWTFVVYSAHPILDGWPETITSKRSGKLTLTTSSYELAAPDDLVVTKQNPDGVVLTWSAPATMAKHPTWLYQVQTALDTGMRSSAKWWTPVSGTTATLTGLKEDQSYYARVRVVDADGTTQRSDRSVYVMAKTLLYTGVINGRVTGATAADLVVGAYDTSDQLLKQVDVSSDGSYTMTIRKGTYRLKASYLGSGSSVSLWATSSGDGAVLSADAASVTVGYGATVSAPTIRLAAGATISGTVYDAKNAVKRAVDVSVLTGSTTARELVSQGRSDNNGLYSVKGVPDGTYWLRFVTSESTNQRKRSVAVVVKDGKVISKQSTADANPQTDPNGFATVDAYLP